MNMPATEEDFDRRTGCVSAWSLWGSMRGLFALLMTLVLIGLSAPCLLASPKPGMATLTASEATRKEMVYYVWNTGDGRLVPTAQGFAEASAKIEIPWFEKGRFSPAWRSVGLSGFTSDSQPVRAVTIAETSARPPALPVTLTASAGGKSQSLSANPGETIVWDGLRPGGEWEPSFLVVDLGKPQTVEWLVLRPATDGLPFPRHFLIESAVAPTGPWYPVVSANFPFFPDPAGLDVWIPLRGLVAGALRVVVPWVDAPAAGWTLAGVDVLGSGEPLLQPGGTAAGDLATWNNLWLNFGVAANEVHQKFDPWWETDRPLDGGMVCIGSCEWFAWGALKVSWLEAEANPDRLEELIARNPVDAEGFAWASGGSDKHLGHSRHFTTNALYATAVAHHYLVRRDRAFLDAKDPKTGETILSKARRAMDYQLGTLGGRSGLLTLPGKEHDGTPESAGTNYWDFWLFGYECAYTNAFFYESLRVMAELEEALGDTARAEELRALRPKVRAAFNDKFWNPATGRYTGWIDAAGVSHDFGFTFVNAMALAFGLPDEAQAAEVLAWLDGTRTVEGDDSTGADIYAFGFAPRANTRDARHGTPPPVNTWNGALKIEPGGNSAFGKMIQNGGAIFYVSYYDLHGRRRYAGADNAARRFDGIQEEFAKDQLRRDPANANGNSDVVGILREFPESGLVPYYFVDGLLGLRPAARGMLIAPALPTDMPSATVSDFYFSGKSWEITADRTAKQPHVEGRDVTVPASGTWLLTPEGQVVESHD